MSREPQFRKLDLDAAPADNEVVAFDTSSLTWKNQTAAEAALAALGGAAFTGAMTMTITGNGEVLIITQPAQTGGSASALDILTTWNAGGNSFTAFEIAITDTASAASSRAMQVLVDASPIFSLNKSGALTLGGHLTLLITDSDGGVEGQIWYDASEDKLKFKTAAGVETITST